MSQGGARRRLSSSAERDVQPLSADQHNYRFTRSPPGTLVGTKKGTDRSDSAPAGVLAVSSNLASYVSGTPVGTGALHVNGAGPVQVTPVNVAVLVVVEARGVQYRFHVNACASAMVDNSAGAVHPTVGAVWAETPFARQKQPTLTARHVAATRRQVHVMRERPVVPVMDVERMTAFVTAERFEIITHTFQSSSLVLPPTAGLWKDQQI